MKKKRIVGLIVVLILLATVTISASAADEYYARFTIINESQHPFSITLYGGPSELKTIPVSAYSKKIAFFVRGDYAFTMTACGATKSGMMNLNIHQTLHVPVCGGTAGALGDKHHHIDASDYIKPVRMKIRNRTGEDIGLYLRTLTDHHFINLKPGEILYEIVYKDQYVYSYVACGELVSGYVTPMSALPFDVKCK
jgi:hypothetical protein